MSIVRLEQVHREVGDFVILDHVDAAIAAGDRIGLVGPNGAGKTTLLRLVAGIDEPDGGVIHRKRAMTAAMLSQEAHVDAAFIGAPSLRQAVRSGDDPTRLRSESLGLCPADPYPYGGRYPCGSLVHNGVWYPSASGPRKRSSVSR